MQPFFGPRRIHPALPQARVTQTFAGPGGDTNRLKLTLRARLGNLLLGLSWNKMEPIS